MQFFQRAVLALGLAACATAPSFAKALDSSTNADWCKRLTGRLSSVSMAACQNSGLKPTGALSRQGFPILMRQVPAAKGGDPVRILLLGGIHGDELTASSIVFQWMQWMHGPLAQEFQWHIVPVVNPDGLLAPKPRRVNANGVDLNRNFPTPNWQHEAPRYWAKATRSDPRRYPGASPLSEPESKWIHDEMERFRPNVIISVHAPFGVLDFDGPAKPPHRFGRLIFNRVGVYPGSLGNYSGLHKNVPVITIELPNATKMPPEAEMRRIWQDMLVWIRNNVKPGPMVVNSPLPRTAEKSAPTRLDAVFQTEWRKPPQTRL
ncbi:MAG TPA: M14 family murein peptide amidase A [Paucimonas sp.]|nr:M14 family murein peptide amidase A [Paucimonas sp.]